jgi:hypothetical protein
LNGFDRLGRFAGTRPPRDWLQAIQARIRTIAPLITHLKENLAGWVDCAREDMLIGLVNKPLDD